MNLSVFNFKHFFTRHEIISLCIGISPKCGAPSISSESFTEYQELARAVDHSTRMANAECAMAHFSSRSLDELPPNLLYPGWALHRIYNKDLGMAWEEIPKDQWPEKGFDLVFHPEKWEYSRWTIVEWLNDHSFKSVYDFSMGKSISKKTDPALMDLKQRERGTLLAIIGALLAIHDQKDAATINEILSRFPTVPGLKQRTLEGKFAEARRALTSN